MRLNRLAPLTMLLAAACSSGGGGPAGSDTPPAVLVESADLVSDGGLCRVRGTVFNQTTTATYEVTLQFEALDSLGRPIALASVFIAELPPQARIPYRTDPFDGPQGTVPCSRIARIIDDDSEIRCTSGTGPGCR
jgi:hypothetical protein